MAWYLGQSWLIIVLSVLLGVLIGWALWRRPWHKRYFNESEAITKVSRENSQALADADRRRADADRTIAAKDAEIERLTGLLDRRPATAVTMPGAAASGDAAAAGSDESATDTAELRVPVPTAEAVDVDAVEASEVDVNDPETGEVDVSAIQVARIDVSEEATAAGQVDVDAAEPAQDAAAPAGQQISAFAGETIAQDGEEADQDELERVEGVGPRIAGALSAAGITTFRKLAESDVAELQSALEHAGLRFAPSLPTWSRQARLLAEGDEAGFIKLTEQLVAGRDVGRRG